MNAATAKTTTGISIRPALLERLDRIAQRYGVSRSRVIGCIMAMTIESLERPEVDWIKVSRRDFERNLTM